MHSEAFKLARKEWEDEGYKKKKRISTNDYTSLLTAILGEADGEATEVQEAIAWVILNRYNSNKGEWGGNKSLKNVCEKFKQAESATVRHHFNLGAGSTQSILNWIPIEIYDSGEDPTKGATYFKNLENNVGQMTIPENCKRTNKIGSYQFYKDGTNCSIS